MFRESIRRRPCPSRPWGSSLKRPEPPANDNIERRRSPPLHPAMHAVAMVPYGGYIIDISAFSRVSRPRPEQQMAAKKIAGKDYDDIPGTYVFDADRSRQGYHLNMFCMSLMKAENRKEFKAGEA